MTERTEKGKEKRRKNKSWWKECKWIKRGKKMRVIKKEKRGKMFKKKFTKADGKSNETEREKWKERRKPKYQEKLCNKHVSYGPLKGHGSLGADRAHQPQSELKEYIFILWMNDSVDEILNSRGLLFKRKIDFPFFWILS